MYLSLQFQIMQKQVRIPIVVGKAYLWKGKENLLISGHHRKQ